MKRNTYLLIIAFLIFQNSVSQETIDLFILAGQSNAMGLAGDGNFYPSDTEPTSDGSIKFNQTLMRNYENNERNWGRPFSTDGWVDSMRIQDGYWSDLIGGGPDDRIGHFGPEVTFGRDLVAAGYNTAIFKFGQGGTSLYDEWMGLNPENPRIDRRLYEEMFRRLEIAVDELENDGYTVNIRGFIWIQGEHDGIGPKNSDDEDAKSYLYYERLTTLITDIRAFAKNSELPIILGVDEQHNNVEAYPTVHNAHQNMAKRDKNIKFTSMVGFPKADASHLDPDGLVRHGKHLFDNFQLLIGEKTKAEINEEFKAEILESENNPDVRLIEAPINIQSDGSRTSDSRVSWGQSFKPNFFGKLTSFTFGSETAVNADFTFTIYNGPDCYGDRSLGSNIDNDNDDVIEDDGIVYSQTISDIKVGDNIVTIPNGLELDREHTYFVQITSSTGALWQARYSDSNNVYGVLRSSNADNTLKCGVEFPNNDLNFTATFEETTLSTNNIQKLLTGTYIYPNPTKSITNVKLNNLKDVSIKVIDINGKILYSDNKINSLNHKIDLSNLKKGIYFVKVNSQGYQKVQKLVLK